MLCNHVSRCVEEGGETYPKVPPLAAVSCPALRPSHLRRLTRALAEAGRKLRGQPMLHELAAEAEEQLRDLQPDDGSDMEGGAETGDVDMETDATETETDLWSRRSLSSATLTSSVPPSTTGGASEVSGLSDIGDEGAVGESELVEGFEGLCLDRPEDASMGGSSDADSGIAGASGDGGRSARPGRRGGRGPRLTPQEAAAEGERLREQLRALRASPQHADIRRVRASLPANSKKEEVVAAVGQHPVVVISGATGGEGRGDEGCS